MAHKIYVGSEKVFDPADYEVAGAVASHAAAADPHPGYLTPAEGDAAYDPAGSAAAAQANAEAASDPAGTAAGLVGTLASLLTTAKTNIVAAINEVVGWIGSLASLTTTTKSTIVASINEVHGEVVTARGASANLDARLDGVDAQLAQKANIATEAWIAPTLLNSWANYGGTAIPAGYSKDSLGVVRLTGVVKSGTAGTVIFNLPTGYRPINNETYFPIVSNSGYACVQVKADGNVVFVSGGTTWVSLSAVAFRAGY